MFTEISLTRFSFPSPSTPLWIDFTLFVDICVLKSELLVLTVPEFWWSWRFLQAAALVGACSFIFLHLDDDEDSPCFSASLRPWVGCGLSKRQDLEGCERQLRSILTGKEGKEQKCIWSAGRWEPSLRNTKKKWKREERIRKRHV